MKCQNGCRAECCGPVPLDVSLLQRFSHKQQRDIKEEMPIDSKHVIALTDDGRCIFLNNRFKCAIYRWRPQVCRLYGTIERLPCPYVDLEGRPRTSEEVRQAKKTIDSKIDDLVSDLLPGVLLNEG